MDLGRFKTVAHQTLHRLGFDVVPYSGRYFSSKLRVETMRRCGVSLVLDVGANEGQYVEEIRRDGWAGSVVSLEPLLDVYRVLALKTQSDERWTALNIAAGAIAAQRVINVAGNTWSSSLLPLTERHTDAAPASRYVSTEIVKIEPLDDIVDLLRINDNTFYLKADTQGYELEVLAGAVAVLQRTAAIELELSLVELYEGQPLFADVMRSVRDLGFVPIDLSPCFVAGGETLQMNGLFVRGTVG
jgi:FkbM family methyltransferase